MCASIRAQRPSIEEKQRLELQETIANLDARWDAGSNSSIPSKALLESAENNNGNERITPSYCLYSFRNNELTDIQEKAINADVKKFASLLRAAFKEYSGGANNRKLKELGKWIAFMQIRVSDLPLKMHKLDLDRFKGVELSELEQSYTLNLLDVAEKVAILPLQNQHKLLAFKYIAAKAIAIPWIWEYLNSEFIRVAHKGGAATDLLTFNRLASGRVPNMKSDSKVWRNAPRFSPEDLTIVDPTSQAAKTGMSIEFNEKETRITYRVPVALKESWVYFNKTSMLVDCETKEQYKVKRIEGGCPLGKTFVFVGCEGKIVELTLIYPPIKKTMQYFTMEDKTVFPVDKMARIRYMQKHNMMSDGGWSSNKTTYRVADYL